MQCMVFWPSYRFCLWHLSNQRLLECFYGIYRDRNFICSGNMCSLPRDPCHSSCISSCCDVLLHCLILGLYHAVHGFLTKLEVWYYIVFPTRGCWKVLWYYKNRHVIYFGYMWNQRLCHVYLEVVVLDHVEIFFSHLDGANLIIKLPYLMLLLDVVLLFISCLWAFTLLVSLGTCWNL